MIGTTIAHYKVTAKLGAGGMGEVYRATDTKLGREVALKVLPAAFAQDAQRMQRFQREAQVLASLNHPNIATIHGLEESGATRALAMELVEGPTLAERIAAGAISLEEALPAAKQIIDGLEYAHERGIIHRDLKPANIKLTNEGQVKILDFGLARAMQDDTAPRDISNSPTFSVAATEAGVILGTAAYMSPEQAKGKRVDKRADIWAFGVVLYEMLTGRKTFAGETATDIMAAVVRAEPDWTILPASVPRHIRGLLQRCLTKDEKRRLRDIGDARLEIEEALSPPAAEAPPANLNRPAHARALLPWGLAVALAIGMVAGWRRALRPTEPKMVMRFSLPLNVELTYGVGFSVSPDGSQLAYVSGEAGLSQLHIRRLDEGESRPVPGANLVRAHFFSPDGKWIGFVTADRKVKKVSLADGTLTLIGETPFPAGGAWGPDDGIIVASVGGGLQEIPASGGAVRELTQLARDKGEVAHYWPVVLPKGNAVLFTRWTKGGTADAAIEALVRKTGERKVLVSNAASALYSPSGHLLFSRGGVLLAVPFDSDRVEVTGPAFRITDQLFIGHDGSLKLAISNSGILIYALQRSAKLVWVDQAGIEQPVRNEPRSYSSAQLSPDGRRIAVVDGGEIWLLDLARESYSRFATPALGTPFPIWTPTGDRVAYTAGGDLVWKRADGSGAEEVLAANPPVWKGLPSFSPNGREAAFLAINAGTSGDIYILSLDEKREVRPFLNSAAYEGAPLFSPTGRYLAYVSDETGQREIYVTPYPGGGRKWQVSTQGGTHPAWTADGRQIFYRQGDAMMAASVSEAGEFTVGKARQLFRGNSFYGLGISMANYSVTRDGGRLVMVRDETPAQGGIRVVLNWFEELRRLSSQGAK